MKRHVISNEKGTTLVELLVAATIMLVIIAAIIAVIRTGTELEISDSHRRVARSIITSWFEENFTHEDYSIIPDPEIFPSFPSSAPFEVSATFENTIIDDKGDGDPNNDLKGTFTIKLFKEGHPLITSDTIYKAQAHITWQEIPGEENSNQTITLTKVIAQSYSPK